MFDCLCLKKFSNRKNLIEHLKSHEILNQFKFPSGCLQTNCKHGSNFNDFAQLNRHLRLFHKETVNEENNLLTAQIEVKGDENANHENEMEIDFINENNVDSIVNDVFDFSSELKNLESEIFSLMLDFKSKSQLSEILLNEIINSFSKLFNKLIESVIKLFFNSFKKLEKNDEEDSRINSLLLNIRKFKNVFNFINSSYKQTKLIENKEEYIKPEEILLGTRDDTV